MGNQQNNRGQNDADLANGIKNAAGAVFHGAHNVLESTENAAMNAVDATANAINNMTGNKKDNRDKQNRNNQ